MDYLARDVGFRVDEERSTIQVIQRAPDDGKWRAIGEARQYPLSPSEIPGDRYRAVVSWDLAWATLRQEHPAVYRNLLKTVCPEALR